MHDDHTPATNRAQRRAGSRAKRIAAVGSSAVLATSAAAFLTAVSAAPAGAVPITVTNLDDSGAGSLRQALAGANDGDTIDLTGLSGTIALTSGELVIDHAVTITGPGASVLAVDGGGNDRVFAAPVTGGGTLTITGLTIQHGDGDAGSGVYMYCDGATGSLVISGVTFANNVSADRGALYFDACDGGDLTISDSRFVNNHSDRAGGAIWTDEGGATTITGTTFVGNQVDYRGGAAVYVDDAESFTVTNSAFVENTSNGGPGGAIMIDQLAGPALIANSTFTGNVANTYTGEGTFYGNGGAIASSSGEFTLLQTTISGNTADHLGDGLYLQMYTEPPAAVDAQAADKGAKARSSDVAAASVVGPAVITGTIVSGNGDGTDDINGSGGDVVRLASNVIGTVADTLNIVDDGGNQMGITDPLLAPLSDNGGPTPTMGLAPGSPALDAGPDPVPDFPGNGFDQRGPDFLRVVNGRVDVGAFEVQAPEPIDIAPKFTG